MNTPMLTENINLDKINNACLMIIAAIMVTGALEYTKSLMLPFVISIFIFAVASPAMGWFQQVLKVHRLLALVMVFGITYLVITLLVLGVTQSLQDFLRQSDGYYQKFTAFVDWGDALMIKYNVRIPDFQLQEALATLPIVSIARNVTSIVMQIMGSSFLVLIFTLFLLLAKQSQEQHLEQAEQQMGKSDDQADLKADDKTDKNAVDSVQRSTLSNTRSNRGSSKLMDDIQSRVAIYLSVKFLTSVVTGLLVGIVLSVMGVDLALMFAILTVLLNFIPSIGSIIATLLPIPVLLLQFGFGWEFYVVLGITGAIQFTIGNIIEPKFIGESLDLHPVTVLMSLMFWGLVWGIPGMFLSLPITATLKIVLAEIDSTKTFSELLAGRVNF